MSELFLKYDTATGEVLARGFGRPGVAAMQSCAPGQKVVGIARAAWRGNLEDALEPVRDALLSAADEADEETRAALEAAATLTDLLQIPF